MTIGSSSSSNGHSLPFVEPHTTTLLVVGSFLYLLNVIYELFQLLFGAGLIGPLILGAIYCVPLGNILPIDIQAAIGDIGYWGLLLLIVEGGLGTRFDILTQRKNSALCILVAFTGICLPIGLSMIVLYFGYKYIILESFIIGAALSVTSLGTTIAIMTSFRFPTNAPQNEATGECENGRDITLTRMSNISETRAGTILMGAAVIDDIPGLVIASVVASLGPKNTESQLSAWVVARPIVSSIIMLIVTAVLAKYICPLIIPHLPSKSSSSIPQDPEKSPKSVSAQPQSPETPNSLMPQNHVIERPSNLSTPEDPEAATISETDNNASRDYTGNKWSYRNQVPNLALLLFIIVISIYVTIASYIGSSRLIGAFCAGSFMSHFWKLVEQEHPGYYAAWSPHASFERIEPVQHYVLAPFFFASIGAAIPVRSLFQVATVWRGILYSALMVIAKLLAGAWLPIWAALERRFFALDHVRASEIAPSWPAGLLVGLALVTRGEIGLLILNIAEAQALVGEESFAVGIWAVVLSTLIGPVGVGTILRSRASNWVIRGPWGLSKS